MPGQSAYTSLQCPNCKEVGQMLVLDSRAVRAENSIRRRRRCDGCGFRFTTYERMDAAPYEGRAALDGARSALRLALQRLK